LNFVFYATKVIGEPPFFLVLFLNCLFFLLNGFFF